MLRIIPFEEIDKKVSASHLQVTMVPPLGARRTPRKVTCYLASLDSGIMGEAPSLLEQRTTPPLRGRCVAVEHSRFPRLEERPFVPHGFPCFQLSEHPLRLCSLSSPPPNSPPAALYF